MTQQYIRRCSLVVSGDTEAIDLSALRIVFHITQADIETPNAARIRVYNLSDHDARKVQREFTRVTLQAGYEDRFGVIFDGTVKQVRSGRESATDTYTDIFAADGDAPLNFGLINTSLAAGSTASDRVNALAGALETQGATRGHVAGLTDVKLPRGRVLYGMARDHLRSLAASNACSYSIQSGALTIIPLDGFIPGEAVILNSQSGLVNIPELTEDGLKVQCLINPLLGVGSRIKINEADIQQAALGLNYTFINNFPGVPGDGIYRIYVIDHVGDTRGNDWHSNIIGLSVDPTVAQGLTPGLLNRGQI